MDKHIYVPYRKLWSRRLPPEKLYFAATLLKSPFIEHLILL